jgi:pyruvate/2-oxoglutarate dehydrogenase complex dihydrolipoamide dehydrogenase (E3) component
VSRRRESEPEQVPVLVIGAGACGVAAARAAAAALRAASPGSPAPSPRAAAGAGRTTGAEPTDGGTSVDGGTAAGAGTTGTDTTTANASDAANRSPESERAGRRDRPRVVLVGDARPGGGARLVADGGALLDCATRGLDWHATLAHLRSVRAVVEDRSREAALRADGVDFVAGRARLEGDGTVSVDAIGPSAAGSVPERLRAARIVLATGDEDRLPELTGLTETRYFTAATVLGLADLPPSMVVIGGGPQGCELAQAFARFGVQVTIVEAAERLLPQEHPEASELVTQALRTDGVRVFTASPAVTVAPTLDGGAWVGIGPGGDVAAEALIIATGRRPALRGLDLPAAGVTLSDRGWVRVDERLATSGPGVLAVGRVTGLLPHGATDPVMARVAGINAVARKPRARWSPVGLPRVVRTLPEVATVGLACADAASVPGARVSALPLGGLEHALLGNSPAGLVSLVGGPPTAARGPIGLPGRGIPVSRLLGATVVGPQAGELAGLVAVALRAGLTVEELADAPLSSRSWSAALQHAAAGFAASA